MYIAQTSERTPSNLMHFLKLLYSERKLVQTQGKTILVCDSKSTGTFDNENVSIYHLASELQISQLLTQ